MRPGLVTVMMPAYNAEQHIQQAIQSVLAQSYPHWELIIVNDGSIDKTAERTSQFTDPRIKVIHQKKGGEAAARNTALNVTQGEFLAFLDADDVYLPRHLELTVCYLQRRLDRQGVFTDGYYCDEVGVQLQTLSCRRRGPFEGRIFEQLIRSSDVFGPPICVVLRSDVIAHYDLQFDTDIVIGPDWDFFTQYADVADFGYVDERTCRYRVHRAALTASVGLQTRALELAKCRIKAIKMRNFRTCSVITRTAVFYDLLVNLLRDLPDRQSEVARWPEFDDLPRVEQARLLRLMASKAVMDGVDGSYIDEWIQRSRHSNPADRRAALLSGMYSLSPTICKLLLRLKTRREAHPLATPPFADLNRPGSVQRSIRFKQPR